ncbi:uncharacterized protein C8R40DRAFT_1021048, partial [Lentinula edodes]|uniref:uncharacterized protein n=1 Tax=Lentinula edodes TaxID=5353 RepID=UPI001E8E7A99
LHSSRDSSNHLELLEKYRSLHAYIAANKVPALNRIFYIANKEGWSVDKLAKKMKDAVDGSYYPKSYSEYERDLAVLLYEIGGGATLYALNHSPLSLPSRFTISRQRQSFSLQESTAGLRITEILQNIKTVFEGYAPGVGRRGINLSQDETASENRLCWCPSTDKVFGLCEHAKRLGDLRLGKDMKSVEKIVRAVRVEKDIHIAQEISVAAFSLYDENFYGARPVLIMPTCKKGDWKLAAMQNAVLLAAWKFSPFGAAAHGDIWSLSSDGDPKRRPALYLVTMVRQVQPSDILFNWLGKLPGLNLLCGPNFETPSFDPKHDIKRCCTLLSSIDGMVVNGVIINKSILGLWFQRLEGHDWTEIDIENVFNFGDHQDVPRAFTLLCLVADLRELDDSDLDPSEIHTFRSLKLLGKLFAYLVEPFLLLDLSLFSQMKRLVKFAYLAFALYVKHGQSFMTPQLYGDIQAMIKNAIFLVAHTKSLDP